MSNLSSAARQYRHNNLDGFVIGYHKEITERVVANLEAEIQSLKQELEWQKQELVDKARKILELKQSKFQSRFKQELLDDAEAEVKELRQALAECQELLKERDGGDHDADCKIYKGRGCNCVHDSVAEYFNPSRHNQR